MLKTVEPAGAPQMLKTAPLALYCGVRGTGTFQKRRATTLEEQCAKVLGCGAHLCSGSTIVSSSRQCPPTRGECVL